VTGQSTQPSASVSRCTYSDSAGTPTRFALDALNW
jgi:hypothetical protein